MRSIGFINTEADARRFGDYLYTLDIDNKVDPAGEGRWEIWVLSDDDMSGASRILSEYTADPSDSRYDRAGELAMERREKEQASGENCRKKYFDRNRIYGPKFRILSVTGILVMASSVIALLSSFGSNHEVVRFFSIIPYGVEDGFIVPLSKIELSQAWRFITPIFIHFGIMHLLFNMLWLADLGTMVETKAGRIRLVALVVVIAVLSNVGQYMASGPSFGGMSGVVYGLLGYVWMKGRFDPLSGMGLRRDTVVMMIAWFFICLSGMMGPIANTAHAVGLGSGVAWGYLSARVTSAFRPGR